MLTFIEVILIVAVLAAAVSLYFRPVATVRKFFHFLLLLRGCRSRFLAAPAGVVHYYQAGRKDSPADPVVLLIGLGGTGADWQSTMRALARYYRVYSPELAGQGKTRLQDESQPYGRASQLELLREFLDLHQIRQAALVGISLGGWLACHFALRYPERVQRLVLVNSAGLRCDLIMEDMQPKNRREALVFLRRLLAGNRWVPGFVLDDLVRRMNSAPICKTLQSLEETDWLDDHLAKIRVPVDIIWGSQDGLIPPDHAERFRSGLAHSRVHILPGCGHVPMYECPGAFNKLLSELMATPMPRA